MILLSAIRLDRNRQRIISLDPSRSFWGGPEPLLALPDQALLSTSQE